MFETIDILSFMISVTGMVQAGLLLLVLRNEGTSAWHVNRWMGIFLLALSMSFARDIVLLLGGTAVALLLEPLLFSAYFALAPAVYLYFREMSGDLPDRPWLHMLAVPLACCAVAAMMVMVFIRYGDRLFGGDPLHITFDTDFDLSLVATGLLVGLFVFVSVYHIALSRVAHRYTKMLKAKGDHDSLLRRRWVRGVVLCLHSALVAFVLSQLLQMVSRDMHWSNMLVNLGFVLVLLRLNFLLASQPFRTGNAHEQTGINDLRPERRSVMDEYQTAQICKRLEQVAGDGQTLFDPLLTMPKLATRIGVTPNQLSHTLNNVLGQSFFEFVNSVRVHRAAGLLCAEHDRTIIDIAMEVGFNSKSTFNLAFKRVTGMTPSHYRTQAITKPDGLDLSTRFGLTPITPSGN
ncbi:AraC family transcriptional regulator [Thalassospira lohafexi]|uniref:HTH araC/xylS-type domain-containing protein n=1 Tax=Thalassospira lohafexi TaxID=744227 RepID=A0A2N3LC90_9PROT|nr:helix-turn-helix domain-containing protein [Thalassospira lohafexi]PKR60388.1 hypothetical protein COO92_03335 [Thalassospira lohafexi]